MRIASKSFLALLSCCFPCLVATSLSVTIVVTTVAADEVSVKLADSPTLSPDGTQLVFAFRNALWSVDSKGGQAKRLAFHSSKDESPAFSPDGTQLAFLSNRSGSSQIFVMPASGGPSRQVTFHSEGFRSVQWYPDGDQLLATGMRDDNWQYRHAIRFLQVSLSERRAEVPLFDDYGSEGSLSPDGTRLLFVREGEQWWRKGYYGSRATQIWLYDLKSGEFTKLLEGPFGSRWPMWTPDGTGFYFVRGDAQVYNLWHCDLSDMENLKTRSLTSYHDDSVVFPTLSADGSTLVFRKRFDLYRLDLTDKNARPQLISITALDETSGPDEQRRVLTRSYGDVAFSSDGLEIAMISGGDLWVMDTELREPVRVTDSAEEENEPRFSPDGKAIYYISDVNGQSDLWKVERKDPEKYWWQNTEFVTTQLTHDAPSESELTWSPTGDYLYFVKGNGDLWRMKPDGTSARQILGGFSSPDFSISPDGEWIVYSQVDNDFNSEIWLLKSDGSPCFDVAADFEAGSDDDWALKSLLGPNGAFNISRHPRDDSSPRWSPDGQKIAFTGNRIGDEVDIYYVWLQRQENEKSSRDRKIEAAVKKIEKSRNKGSDKKDENKESSKVVIDFDGLHERIRKISISNSSEYNLTWSHDGKKLAFVGTVDSKRGIYTVEFPDQLTPKLLTTSTLSSPKWLDNGALVGSFEGIPASISTSGSRTTYSFQAHQILSRSGRYIAAFDRCWQTMRDEWYDERLNHRNWDEIRRRYRDAAGECVDDSSFSTVIHLMLGELNGSHLGFTASGGGSSSSSGWTPTTAHLGLRFDRDYQGPGLKVRDVLTGGPADAAVVDLKPGDVVQQIDGRNVDPLLDLTEILNGRLDRDITLLIAPAKTGNADESGADSSAPRTVVLRPISYNTARRLMYEEWLEFNRNYVSRLSQGTMGYLHIEAMNQSSFEEFQRQLYAAGYGKEGLVIDVRDNGGGSTTDHLLTSLTQPDHAITVPRGGGQGYPHSRRVYATWRKPIVVMCNQNSYSNAEIFSHAIKTLKRGAVVGVPTAGGVVSTGRKGIMDVGSLRLPFRGWFLVGDGEDMELNGAVPDYIVWPKPGEIARGYDAQIEKAVEVLGAEIETWNARPQPSIHYGSDRQRPEDSAALEGTGP